MSVKMALQTYVLTCGGGIGRGDGSGITFQASRDPVAIWLGPATIRRGADDLMVKLELKRLRVKLRASVKKLMAKGLSAQEAGRLVFMDSWEVDHDRASLLIRRDIDRLRNGLRSSKDTQEYNAIIGLYRVVDFIRREREFVYLRSLLQVKDVINATITMELLKAEDTLIKAVEASTQGNKQTGTEKFSAPEKGRAADKVAAALAELKESDIWQLIMKGVDESEPSHQTLDRLIVECITTAKSILPGLRKVAAATQVLYEVGEYLQLPEGFLTSEDVDTDDDPWAKYLAARARSAEAFKGRRLPAIPPLESIRPEAATLAKYRSWIAERIGEDWWMRSLEGPGGEEEAKDG